ncbi:MAG TPA: methionyl-tRNA formyltransferase [Lachnospiraceae bacterium]|nr:methionyl-tRNA formyltransferase [Lachnospiraceae bacterium]
MKIVFMGTPEYAAEALEALISAGHEVVAVVTQPDKARGRSRVLLPPPVKTCALKYGIPVLQPRRIRKPEAVAELKQYPADVYVVAAFGQILSQEILDIPPRGCLNIHASLLPGYRGASPIQHVILGGEKKTGITIMQMDAGIDTGGILYQKEIPIRDDDNYETLHDKLAALGGQAITEALTLLEQGKLIPRKQQENLSSYAPLIGREMGELDFTQGAADLDRRIRAMIPWPGAYTSYQGKQLKIWRAEPVFSVNTFGRSPGEILSADKNFVTVAAGEGALRIYELQLEGRKRMTAHDFLLGVRMQPGEVLGCIEKE